MNNRASGTFEVKLNPQDDGPDAPVGRMTIDKQFQGDLAGTSKARWSWPAARVFRAQPAT